MNLSEIVQLLHPFVGSDYTKGQDFLIGLLDSIFDENSSSAANPLDKINPDTANRIFNGSRKLQKNFAITFTKSLDIDGCIEFLEENITDGSYTALEQKLIELGIRDEKLDVTEQLANLLVTALTDIATTTKRKTPSVDKSNTQSFIDDIGRTLFLQEGGKCPNDGCSHLLYKKIGLQTIDDYDVVQVDSNLPLSLDNAIALCHDCKIIYESTKSPTIISRMKEIKKQLLRNYETLDIVRDYSFQDGLERVVRKIAEIPASEIVELNYDPVQLVSKIPNDIILLSKVRSQVANWYLAVNGIFKEVSSEKGLKYKSLCSEIRTFWTSLDEDGRSQYEIYSTLTDWFANRINDRKDLCEIVVSYFIQECEVFIDASTK